MHRKHIPLWIYIGGGALTLMAGCINAVGFMSLQRQALSHMSGMVTALGMNSAIGEGSLAWHALAILVAFFLGGVLSGFVIRQSSLQVGRRYGAVLAIESLLLFAAVACMRSQNAFLGDYFAAMACGLQNGMASSYSGAVIRTTHCTGMVTDLGIACGQLLRRQEVEMTRFKLYGVLLGGFLAGSFLGATGYQYFGTDTLLFPAFIAGITGVSYVIFKHNQRQVEAGRPGLVAEVVAVPTTVGRGVRSAMSFLNMSSDFLSSRVINKALARLAALAAEQALIVEVALCHGRVFVVAYEFEERLTEARRKVVAPARTADLLRQLAREMRLPADWLEQDLRFHLALKAARGVGPLPESTPNLVLSIAMPAQILAVKLHAYNAAPLAVESDARELAFLLEKSGFDSVEAVERSYASFFPSHSLAAGLRERLLRVMPAGV